MKKLWILLTIAVLLFFWRFREGFEATENIKDPKNWDAAEINRIKSMVTPKSNEPDDIVRSVVGGFWPKWKEANLRITSQQISDYLANNSYIQGTPGKRDEYAEMLRQYYIVQGQSVFVAARGYNPEGPNVPPPESTEPGKVKKPSTGDTQTIEAVSTYISIPRNKVDDINNYINKLIDFYDNFYMPDQRIPTSNDIQNYVEQNMKTDIHKAGFISLVDYWFTSDETKEGASYENIDKTTGGSSGSLFGATSGGPSQGDQAIFGPLFTGTGNIMKRSGADSSKTNNYPKLIGGIVNPTNTGRLDGVGMIKPTLPFRESSVPGDLDFIPDPYRVSLTYTPSSYSSGKDPIPFLTDFSAFQK